jgi:hypothetical protein
MTMAPSPTISNDCSAYSGCVPLMYKTLSMENQEQIAQLNAAMIFLVGILVILLLVIGISCTLHPEAFSCNHIADHGKHKHGHNNNEAAGNSTGTDNQKKHSALRIRLTGLKASQLNGRMGWTTKFITDGEAAGRYHIVLDGNIAPKEGNFWPKNCISFDNKIPIAKTQKLSKEDQNYVSLGAKRICIVGLNAQILNGRTGTRVRYLTEGHGYGRFHVLLDGKHEPREGNFWPKNLLELADGEQKIGFGNGSLGDTKVGSLHRLMAKRPELAQQMKKKARHSKSRVEQNKNKATADTVIDVAAQHKEVFDSCQNKKLTAAQRRLSSRLKGRLANISMNRIKSQQLKKMGEKNSIQNKTLCVDNDWE